MQSRLTPTPDGELLLYLCPEWRKSEGAFGTITAEAALAWMDDLALAPELPWYVYALGYHRPAPTAYYGRYDA